MKRREFITLLGGNLQIGPMHRLEDGINAVRVFLPKCWFDAEKCARGIDALKLYRAEYDDKLQALRPRPVHDWPHRVSAARRCVIAQSADTIAPVPPWPRGRPAFGMAHGAKNQKPLSIAEGAEEAASERTPPAS
jgi:phage terminase large subunit